MMLLKENLYTNVEDNKYEQYFYKDFISKIKKRYIENPLNKKTFDILFIMEKILEKGIKNILIFENNEDVLIILSKNSVLKLNNISLQYKYFGKHLVLKFNLQ